MLDQVRRNHRRKDAAECIVNGDSRIVNEETVTNVSGRRIIQIACARHSGNGLRKTLRNTLGRSRTRRSRGGTKFESTCGLTRSVTTEKTDSRFYRRRRLTQRPIQTFAESVGRTGAEIILKNTALTMQPAVLSARRGCAGRKFQRAASEKLSNAGSFGNDSPATSAGTVSRQPVCTSTISLPSRVVENTRRITSASPAISATSRSRRFQSLKSHS